MNMLKQDETCGSNCKIKIYKYLKTLRLDLRRQVKRIKNKQKPVFFSAAPFSGFVYICMFIILRINVSMKDG